LVPPLVWPHTFLHVVARIGILLWCLAPYGFLWAYRPRKWALLACAIWALAAPLVWYLFTEPVERIAQAELYLRCGSLLLAWAWIPLLFVAIRRSSLKTFVAALLIGLAGFVSFVEVFHPQRRSTPPREFAIVAEGVAAYCAAHGGACAPTLADLGLDPASSAIMRGTATGNLKYLPEELGMPLSAHDVPPSIPVLYEPKPSGAYRYWHCPAFESSYWATTSGGRWTASVNGRVCLMGEHDLQALLDEMKSRMADVHKNVPKRIPLGACPRIRI
jgi:hypothetical protein